MSNLTANSTRLVACLESFLSPTIPITTPSKAGSPALHLLPPTTLSKLKILGHPRIRDMRVLGHTTQVLSHLPIATNPQTCMKLNDALDASTRMQNDKICALALLPNGKGEGREAARELQRCVTKMKFAGGVMAMGEGLGDQTFEEVWVVAQKFGVPIVLREEWPTGDKVCLELQRGMLVTLKNRDVDKPRSQSTHKTWRLPSSLRLSRTCTPHMPLLQCPSCACTSTAYLTGTRVSALSSHIQARCPRFFHASIPYLTAYPAPTDRSAASSTSGSITSTSRQPTSSTYRACEHCSSKFPWTGCFTPATTR